MGPVRLTKRLEFSASHRYHNPAWSDERNRTVFGRCNNLHGHGHNYLLEVTIEGAVDDDTGMVINLYDVKQVLQPVIEEFDHKDLHLDTPVFRSRIPTTENLSVVLWDRIAEKADGFQLSRIRLFEEEDLYVDYEGRQRGDAPEVTLPRRYQFSAAHRLHSPVLSEEENRKVFGKCNNPNGHGHNYTVEVTIRGLVNPETGMVTGLDHLDRVVDERVIQRFDHQHLNYDKAFAETVTTGENLVLLLWALLEKAVPEGTLDRIGLVETRDNYFEYRGEKAGSLR
ncbi:MAG: 6-pyruvoyl tetrahydropterin synthase [Nitrospirae bacterium]|nr:MAG: 6-pyruvoyl tetrahydropterin synthase [Nitrospirota bacterium]